MTFRASVMRTCRLAIPFVYWYILAEGIDGLHRRRGSNAPGNPRL